jgi:hypothetical protein
VPYFFVFIDVIKNLIYLNAKGFAHERGAIGQYIDITFNGTYTNSTGSHTINGVAHVIRDN